MNHRIWAWSLASLLGLTPAAFAATQIPTPLPGPSPVEIHGATKLMKAPSYEVVHLSLLVDIDRDLLRQTLQQIYGKHAPKDRHYLSSYEFSQKFNLAEKREAIKEFARANGLTVDPNTDFPQSMIVKVSGSVVLVEKALGVPLFHYRAADGQIFRGYETEPRVPAALTSHLGAIIGLSNRTGVFHPHYRIQKGFGEPETSKIPSPSGLSSHALTGNGPGGGLAPADIKSIYDLNSVPEKGTGQKVALVEFDGYDSANITQYLSHFSLPSITVTPVSVDGKSNTAGGGTVEVVLDIDMVAALAPGLSEILVYEAPNSNAGALDMYDRIATDNAAAAISVSWGRPEAYSGASFCSQLDVILQRMASQGQSIFAASGDHGAYDDGSTLSVDDPASQPFMTGVGGTTLSGTLSSWTETVWKSGVAPTGSGGGGGFSTIWTKPDYQVGIPGMTSPGQRNVPDVSLDADPASGYSIYVGGWGVVGGTSASAPLWAGFTALLNQRCAGASRSALGFANPTLYEFGVDPSYASLFVDITAGDNLHYAAGTGYDNATGWGSFRGSALITAISSTTAQIFVQQAIYPYPNPWDIRRDSARDVTFANIPDGGTVKIFTLSGFWVRTLTAQNGSLTWDLKNDSGNKVASGLYFYLAQTPAGVKVKGKLAVIK